MHSSLQQFNFWMISFELLSIRCWRELIRVVLSWAELSGEWDEWDNYINTFSQMYNKFQTNYFNFIKWVQNTNFTKKTKKKNWVKKIITFKVGNRVFNGWCRTEITICVEMGVARGVGFGLRWDVGMNKSMNKIYEWN